MSFDLSEPGRADLTIYDVAGHEVKQLLGDTLPSGSHSQTWDGRDDAGHEVASGTYLVRLVSTGGTIVKRVVLLR